MFGEKADYGPAFPPRERKPAPDLLNGSIARIDPKDNFLALAGGLARCDGKAWFRSQSSR
jgi:hypothetical protein